MGGYAVVVVDVNAVKQENTVQGGRRLPGLWACEDHGEGGVHTLRGQGDPRGDLLLGPPRQEGTLPCWVVSFSSLFVSYCRTRP